MSTGGKLPVELERLVFEAAAQNRSIIPTLVLVAHRVRVWLEPLLYNVLLFDAVPNITGILDSIRTKPALFLTSAVRHVLMYSSPDSLDTETLVKFLESCSGITTLSLIGVITGPRLLPALGNMHIRRLSVDVRQLFGLDKDVYGRDDSTELEVDLDHPLFGAVTHLDLFDEVDIEDEEPEQLAWLLQDPSKLPALTHLAFNTQPNPLVLQKLLTRYPQLHVLIVAFNAKEEDLAAGYMEELTIADLRLVVATYANYYIDWELGARGGDDLWVRSEEFVSRKRRGEIEGTPDTHLLAVILCSSATSGAITSCQRRRGRVNAVVATASYRWLCTPLS
ncbi:hypothetical protein DFH08DRAFT_235803 [Mycena albidolilacea]|uniref:Uncharacterized protein n=1 Tax=Mycena albidolilacea TaxID=1033008 RepID=A0AAD7EN96_9AGAR|nr:hypothetical protein DFH08DRAFT_235803 [Mycena albidolilacea]